MAGHDVYTLDGILHQHEKGEDCNELCSPAGNPAPTPAQLEYRVVEKTDLDLFSAAVTRLLNNGWQLQGGLSVSGGYYAQSLVRHR